MLSVPVTTYRIAAFAFAALIALPVLAAPKEDRKPRVAAIRKTEQLENDRGVRAWRKPYLLDATANYIHQECADKLGLAPQRVAFVAARFAKSRSSFTNALDKAFVDRMKTHPTEEVKKDFIRYLDELPKQSIENTESVIKYRSCKDYSLSSIVEYYKKLQEIEDPAGAAAAAATPVAPAAAPTTTAPVAAPVETAPVAPAPAAATPPAATTTAPTAAAAPVKAAPAMVTPNPAMAPVTGSVAPTTPSVIGNGPVVISQPPAAAPAAPTPAAPAAAAPTAAPAAPVPPTLKP